MFCFPRSSVLILFVDIDAHEQGESQAIDRNRERRTKNTIYLRSILNYSFIQHVCARLDVISLVLPLFVEVTFESE